MKPLHEFLIPRLYLVQGGRGLQVQHIERLHLNARNLTFRTPWSFRRFFLRKCSERVVKMDAAIGIVHTSRALAERPCRAVPDNRFGSEALDVAFGHAFEVVPRLIVLARMNETEPDVLVQILARSRNPI